MSLNYEKEGHIARVGLNRPKERNALDCLTGGFEMIMGAQFYAELRDKSADPKEKAFFGLLALFLLLHACRIREAVSELVALLGGSE
jgi:hypothetical protein